jgi:glycosyltransferase involved in cell wall biosynthesis
MRILLVTSMVPDLDGVGAIPKLLHAQLTGLRERHDVTLVAPVGEDAGQAEAAERLRASDLDAHFVDRRRARSARRRWRVRAELARTWLSSDWPWRVVCGVGGVQASIDNLLATKSFDVIAVEDNPMSVLRLPSSLPAVLTEHEAVRAPANEWLTPRLSERPMAALRARDWRRWDSFLPSVWRRFDLLQVFSEGDARAVSEQAPDLAARVRVNPYGIVLPPVADPDAEVAGTILFAGTFSHLPNRDAARWLATEIMPRIAVAAPAARLQIVGSSPPREVLDLAGPGVEVIADPPSVEPHLAAASVVIAPVRSGGGMRMKVLEPLAKGKAVVTTSLGAEGFTGFEQEPPFAIADSSEEIAAATAQLLGDDAARRRLAQRAREFAQAHHSPEAWAARLARVYEEARALAVTPAPRGGS